MNTQWMSPERKKKKNSISAHRLSIRLHSSELPAAYWAVYLVCVWSSRQQRGVIILFAKFVFEKEQSVAPNTDCGITDKWRLERDQITVAGSAAGQSHLRVSCGSRVRHWQTGQTGSINNTTAAIPAAPYSSAFSCRQNAALVLICEWTERQTMPISGDRFSSSSTPWHSFCLDRNKNQYAGLPPLLITESAPAEQTHWRTKAWLWKSLWPGTCVSANPSPRWGAGEWASITQWTRSI